MPLIRMATGSSTKPLPGSIATRLRSPDKRVSDEARAALHALAPELLLQEARAVGLAVTATAFGALRVRGPEGTEELARLLLARKAELLPLVRSAPALTTQLLAKCPNAGTPQLSDLAAALLADLHARGFTVTAEGNNLFVTPRQHLTETDYAVIRRHKTELLDIIRLVDAATSLFPVEPAAPTPHALCQSWEAQQRLSAQYAENQARPWRDVEADAEHQKALAVLAAAEAATWLSEAQRNLLVVFRRQVQDYREQHNRQLFGAAAWIQGYVNRWRAEHKALIRRDGI